MIYLDNAATSFPKPKSVMQEMLRVQNNFAANPGRSGHEMAMKAGEIIFDTRVLLAEKFNCKPERVIFTSNCTSSLNLAIFGTVKPNSHVIISSLEHNSVYRPIHKLKCDGKISYSIAKVQAQDDFQTVQSFEKLINQNTTHIICTHASNVFGTLLPIEKIGMLAKKHNLTFIVDAAQSAGAFEIDMKKCNIDVLCVPAHKGLFGVMGTGAMLMGDGTNVQPSVFGGTGSLSLSEVQPDFYPDRLESGTLNLLGISALGEGMKFLKCYGGEEAVHEKQTYLCEILKEDLAVIPNIITYEKMHSKDYSSVVSFNIKNHHSEQIAQKLYDQNFVIRAGYQCASLAHNYHGTIDTGVIRLSAGIFNTKKDVKNIIFYINKIAKSENMC